MFVGVELRAVYVGVKERAMVDFTRQTLMMDTADTEGDPENWETHERQASRTEVS